MSDEEAPLEREHWEGQLPAELISRSRKGEQMWTTEQLVKDFDVLGFEAPFVVVKRKADGQTGSLQFTHSPRWYYAWMPD